MLLKSTGLRDCRVGAQTRKVGFHLLFENPQRVTFSKVLWQRIALFTDNILHLHYNEIERECEAISGKNDKIARNCLASTLNCFVMQICKVICEKGYSTRRHHYKKSRASGTLF